MVWKATSAWDMVDSFTLVPEANTTRVVYEMDYRLAYGLLGALYGKLVLERRMRRHLEGVLERMKRLCETPL